MTCRCPCGVKRKQEWRLGQGASGERAKPCRGDKRTFDHLLIRRLKSGWPSWKIEWLTELDKVSCKREIRSTAA